MSEDTKRVPLLKARVIGGEGSGGAKSILSRSLDVDDRTWQQTGAITPPYDPETLCKLLEHSNSLRQNVDAYATNIDGYGHRFEPVIDLEADDIDERIRAAIMEHRAHQSETDKAPTMQPVPTDEDIAARKAQLAEEMAKEKTRLERFFRFCCPNESFISLRRRTRQDIEVIGYGFWEILRNPLGEIVELVGLPSFTMRLRKLEDPTEVEERIQTSELSYDTRTVNRRFRTYVQKHENQTVYFKEFGDHRTLSAKTGKMYKNVAEMEAEESNDAIPASEVLYFQIASPRTSYGIPRWIGVLLAVLGSRESEEVNYAYFENKSIPPLMLMVAGGRLSEDTVTRLEDAIENDVKGKSNFHKMLILEAEPYAPGQAENAGRMRIDLKPLTGSQNQDSLFIKYDERNIDKVGGAFRLPRLLRGDVRDFNRACYDEHTETLTLDGWKRIDEFKPDDKIAAYDPRGDVIGFVKPEALHVYDVDEELLHFRSSVADIMVTEDHRMLAKKLGEGPFSVFDSQSIPFPRFALKTVAGGCDGQALASFLLPKDANCQIERGHDHVSSIDGDTFLEFLGYWLSEGSLLSTEHPSAPYLVTLSQKSGRIADEMVLCLEKTGWAFSESRDEVASHRRWCLSNRCLSSWLRENCGGMGVEKRLPGIARNLSAKQSRILFDALMNGDGYWDARPNRTSGYYSSTSRQLCDDVQALAIRLGYRASISMHYPASEGRKTCWRVQISDGRDAEFRAPPERVHYQGRVYCFSVPGYGFFVTRRNGKVAIQGNTADASLRFAEQQVFQPEREDFDWLINRKLLSDMGISFWRFVSNGPIQRDPRAVIEDTRGLVKDGVLTPAEGRGQLTEVLRRELKEIDADWTKQPIQLTLAGIPVEGAAMPAVAEPAAPAVEEEEEKPAVEAPAPERAAAVELTATTVGQVLTVNEGRSALGFGPLKRPDGTEDPDGHLTIESFAAKRGDTEKVFRDGIDKALSQIELAQELREIG